MQTVKWATALASLTAAMAYSGIASASTWAEVNAGDTPATAEVVLGASPLDAITGFLSVSSPVGGLPTYQVDLFKIVISNFNSFSARTVSAVQDDTALFLFDSSGHGVYMNDDNGVDFLSYLPSGSALGPSANGTYYIGVGIGGMAAKDGSSADVFQVGSFTDVLAGAAGAGPVASWVQQFPTFSEAGLSYRIEFTGASPVPEASTWLLLCLGLAGLAAAGRRQRARVA